jgi:hypothetical protein
MNVIFLEMARTNIKFKHMNINNLSWRRKYWKFCILNM